MTFNVALLSIEYPPFIYGGVGTFCYDLANKLSQNQIYTTVVTGKSKSITCEYKNNYLKIIRLPLLNFPPDHIWFQLKNFGIIKYFLNDINILHCISHNMSFMCSYLKRKLEKPMVTSLHGQPLTDLQILLNSPFSTWAPGDFIFNILEYPLSELLFREALNKSDRIITCSNSALNEIIKTYPKFNHKNISVIYNAINFNKINDINVNSSQNIKTNKYILVYYGRLYWRKGIVYLLYALLNLKEKLPQIELRIFGKGPMENLLNKMIKKLGLNNVVKMKGHVPYIELLRNIKMADVITLPSLYEAQSISMLEAMALNKPIVAFDLPFASECITNYVNGLLAKPRDVKDLSNKIEELLINKEKRIKIGQNAYNYVKKNHNWDIQIEKYIDIYNDMA